MPPARDEHFGPDPTSSRHPLVSWASLLAGLVGSVAIVAALGASFDPPGTVSLVFGILARSLPWASLWLVSSLGLGLLASRLLRIRTDCTLSLTIGVALSLTYAHTLGTAGLLNVMSAWLPIGVGCVGLIMAGRKSAAAKLDDSGTRSISPIPTAPRWLWLTLPALAVMLVAAASPPGWLWESEFGGYDTLSYHLALPREWIRLAQVATLEANVYSALPSFMEVGYAHIAILMGAKPGSPAEARSLLIDGSWAPTAHLMHALIAAAGVWACARASSEFVRASSGGNAIPAKLPLAAFLLATPWVIITGSLAYNEMAVVLLAAGACLAALQTHTPPTTRGLLAGLLLAAATGCKPTALLVLSPIVALCLLSTIPKRAWIYTAIAGCAAGLAVLTPWLVRNALATHNPVFPFATDLFGTGHWTPDQAARWASAHAFEGTLLDRLQTALWLNPHAPGGALHVERYRGLIGPQWLAFWPITIASAMLAIVHKHTRRAAGIAIAALALGLLVWISLTHIQARFLVPLIVPASMLIALAASAIAQYPRRLRLGAASLALITLAHAGLTIHRFAWLERDAKPLLALELGPKAFLGVGLPDDPAYDPPRYYANRELDQSHRLLLVGDARAFWWLPPTFAPTTWDTNPLAEIIRVHPDDPAAWIEQLRNAGFTHVVIDRPEVDRLASDGRLDPALNHDALNQLVDAAPGVRLFPVGQMVYLQRPPSARNTP